MSDPSAVPTDSVVSDVAEVASDVAAGNVTGAVAEGVEALDHVSILHSWLDRVHEFLLRFEGKTLTPTAHAALVADATATLESVKPTTVA